MPQEHKKLRLLTTLVALLVIAVGLLGYQVVHANHQISRLVAQANPASDQPKDQADDQTGDQDQDFQLLTPDQTTADPWDLLNQPFDAGTWDPFQEMQNMRRQMDQVFNNAFGRFGQSPRFDGLMKDFTFNASADMVDQGDKYVIRLDVPGAQEADVKVKLEGQVLTVAATTNQMQEEESKGTVLRKERRIGTFTKQLTLPEPVDEKTMQTECKDGVFTITIQKAS